MQDPVSYCDKCGNEYAQHQRDTVPLWCPPLQCTHCLKTRRVGPTPIAVLLQPVIGPSDTTGLLVAWSDERNNQEYKGLTLPQSHIRLRESAEDTIVRTTKDSIGITLNPDSLKIFETINDFQKQELYLFYENKQRIHQRELSVFKKNTEIRDVQVIQTTYGTKFVCPSYEKVADRFINNMWRHFRS